MNSSSVQVLGSHGDAGRVLSALRAVERVLEGGAAAGQPHADAGVRAADQARLARLERAGVVRRGRPISRKLLNEAPPTGSKGASAVQALLDERRSGR